MADKPITRRLKIYVNGQEVDKTITNLTKNLRKFRAQAARATEGSAEWKKYNTQLAKTELELSNARKSQKAFKDEIKLTENGISDTTKTLGDFTSSVSQMFSGIKSGNYLDIQDGFNGVKKGIVGATKAGLAFIATPIGAAIAALAGIGLVAKQWLDYNTAVVEALRLTTSITGLTDQAADQARIRAEALVETFDVDFKETLLTAKNLATQFGISFEEAFNTIEGQLVRGQKNNDEFFESLKEYPAFFKAAGFSADEFGKIIATGFDLGIYNDKLPDALKEADLSLKEQTKTTRDALVNAFGAPFTNDILKRVRTGETTTKDALAEIAAEADKTGINVQQNAQLTADLFKGAGEDAGGALKVFEALDTALNKQQRELTESEQITQEQITATKELKAVSSALFSTGDKGFGLLIDKAKLFGTKMLVDILKAGVDVYNWFVDLNNESAVFSGIISTIGELGTAQFRIIFEILKLAKNQFGSLGDIITGVFTLDKDLIKQGIAGFAYNTTKALDNLKKEAIASGDAIANAFSGNNKLERKNLDDFIGTDAAPTTPNSPNLTPDDDGDGNDLTDEDKKIIESRKKLYEQLKALEEEQDLQKELQKLDKDQRNEEEEILRKEAEFEKLINDNAADAELKLGFEEALQFELQQIRDKYADERLKKKEKSDKAAAKLDEKNKKQLIDAEDELAQAKADALNTGINLLQSLFDESTAIYKALFLAQKIAAASEVIINGIRERAAIGADPLIFAGAKPAMILASKIRTGISLATIAATAIQGFEEGGETFGGPSSGGIDGRGGRLSILHPGEYVIPKVVRQQNPEVPNIISYLERKRQANYPSFEEGGEAFNVSQSNTATVSTSNGLMITEATGQELINSLKNLEAKVYYGIDQELQRQEIEDKIESTKNASKT